MFVVQKPKASKSQYDKAYWENFVNLVFASKNIFTQHTNFPNMRRQISEKNSNSQNVYIGLDVHLKQWNVCIIQGGVSRKPFQQEPTATALMNHLRSHFPGMNYYSAYEAGVCGLSIHYALMSAGINSIVFNPADIAQRDKDRKRKTDPTDARKIARALYNGELDCIHIPSEARAADRNLLRLRGFCIDDVKRAKIRLRHFLHVNGIAIPSEFSHGHWTKAFFGWLESRYRNVAGGVSTAATLKNMTQSVQSCIERLEGVNSQLTTLMKTPAYAEDFRLLMSVPGIGPTAAFTLLLECGDLRDFSSADKFCAFIGLVPDINRSGDHDCQCGITRRRHKTLRYMLTESAWHAIRIDDNLSALFADYTRRMPRQKAIVKIANKLAKIIKFVLKNKTAYKNAHG